MQYIPALDESDPEGFSTLADESTIEFTAWQRRMDPSSIETSLLTSKGKVLGQECLDVTNINSVNI